MGREEATKTICDKHNRKMLDMRNRANAVRYKNMAHDIIGKNEEDVIYSPDYACDMGSTFGNDETNV
jgi:hypothetical protein